MIRHAAFMALGALVALGTAAFASDTRPAKDQVITVYEVNPWYWQYKAKPVFLLGGTVSNNLFQIPNHKKHLDLLKSVGGNYVRIGMMGDEKRGIQFFGKSGDKYDLNTWNDDFWQPFEQFLQLAEQRNIIVQLEMWETFTYYRDSWDISPFNPKNNINYSYEQTGLPEVVDSHPVLTQNNFFWSVPAERNQRELLKYQTLLIDKVLSYTFKHGNILYCMDNETAVTPEWGKHWSLQIQKKAKEAGVHVNTTEMWDPHDLNDPKHANTIDHPEIYSFVDVSQNNHQRGQRHYDNGQKARARVAKHPRPMNNIKIYGSDEFGRYGSTRDGIERFWRNIMGGMAAVRFHRPPAGIGLSEEAQASIRSARMLTDSLGVFTFEPHNDLLSDREENEAYCLADPGRVYAVYFTDGGAVTLDVTPMGRTPTVRWLNISESKWQNPKSVRASDSKLVLAAPSGGHWAVLVR